MKDYAQYTRKHRQLILDALDYIWKNPETGYREWKTHAYLEEAFAKLGYELTLAGDIPGFTAEVDTGRPGPTLAVFGEMDSLIVKTHPDADPVTGAVHACGHCCQTATLLGLAAVLKEPGALDGLSGKIRLVAVPAEELIELEYRQELRKQGIVIPEEAVRLGMAETLWPARLEWCRNVLIDGAHNPQGVAALVDYVDACLADKRRVLLSGVLADKLQKEMLGQMVHIARDIVTVTPDTPRALAAADYAAALNDCGGNAMAASTLAEGLQMALDLAGEDGVVIAAGSLYFAGALRTELNLEWK